MAPAWKLFDAGDKLSARKAAEAVLAANPTAAEQQQAQELLERLRTPPFAWIMAGVVAAVAITLTLVAQRYLG